MKKVIPKRTDATASNAKGVTDVKYQRIKGILYIFVNGKLSEKVEEDD